MRNVIIVIITFGIALLIYNWIELIPFICLLLITGWPFIKSIIHKKEFNPAEPIYGLVAYIFIGIGIRGILLQYGFLDNRYLAPINNLSIVSVVYILTIMGVFFMYVGYYSRFGDRLNKKLKTYKFIKILNVENERYTTVFLLICSIIGFFSFLIFYHRYQLIFNEGLTPARIILEKQKLPGGSYYLSMLGNFVVVGSVIASEGRFIPKRPFLFLINIIPLILWYWTTASKSVLLQFIFSFVICRHFLVKPLLIRNIILLLMIFPFFYDTLQIMRNYGINSIQHIVQSFQDTSWLEASIPFLNRSYHFDICAIILDKVSDVSHLKLGSTFKELFYFFIPRDLWPSKPMAFGYTFSKEFMNYSVYHTTTSYAVPLIGEFYLNFNLIGIILGMALLGIISRTVYLLFKDSNNIIMVSIYSVILFRIINSVEGPLAGHIVFMISSLVPFVFYLLLAKMFSLNKFAKKY